MNRTMFIDTFSTGIDEMKRKDQFDPVKVLQVLKSHPRFSSFEASANQTIARTITLLFDRNLLKHLGGQYPWTDVEITALGESVLSGAPVPAKADPLAGFVRISKTKYVTEEMFKRMGLKKFS